MSQQFIFEVEKNEPPALKLNLSAQEGSLLKNIAPNYVFAEDDTTESVVSMFGTPVLMPWCFEYTNPNTNTFNRVELPHATVGSFERAKRIVETYVQNRDEPVYENIGQDAWAIELQGVIVSTTSVYPLQEIVAIERACAQRKSLRLVNRICERLGITQVVVMHRAFTPIEGASNACTYTISCKSDSPFELEAANDLNSLL